MDYYNVIFCTPTLQSKHPIANRFLSTPTATDNQLQLIDSIIVYVGLHLILPSFNTNDRNGIYQLMPLKSLKRVSKNRLAIHLYELLRYVSAYTRPYTTGNDNCYRH